MAGDAYSTVAPFSTERERRKEYYVIRRPPTKPAMPIPGFRCPHCGHWMFWFITECDNCGHKVAPFKRKVNASE